MRCLPTLQCNAKREGKERENAHTQTRINEWKEKDQKQKKYERKSSCRFCKSVAILCCTQYFITIYLMSCWTVWRYLVSVHNMISCVYLDRISRFFWSFCCCWRIVIYCSLFERAYRNQKQHSHNQASIVRGLFERVVLSSLHFS